MTHTSKRKVIENEGGCRVLVTCPPMLGKIELFRPIFEEQNIELVTPSVIQTMTEAELVSLVPTVDGWIIGDDPATEKVFQAGMQGRLRAAVKWGVGVDNVDFKACKRLGIPISNTPNMFGAEVADVAIAYVIGLARHLFHVHEQVRNGSWPKPTGTSLSGAIVALIGYGDIGKATANRLLALGMRVIVFDPFAKPATEPERANVSFSTFPDQLNTADFIVITCALTPATLHMFNADILSDASVKRGVRLINVSRGAIVQENALVEALRTGLVEGAALEVLESEPLSLQSPLRQFSSEKMVFGSHNASNTEQAVIRASRKAISILFDYLGICS